MLGKKIWRKKLKKKNFRKFKKKNLEKNGEKKFWKKNFEKKIRQNNVGKINHKTKKFTTKIYSNIDKCHTIFALLASFDKTGRKAGGN